MNRIVTFGEIEAKKSFSITCPDIWPQPKIKMLIREGSQVKKDEIVCELEVGEVSARYESALKEVEMSKAEYNKSLAELKLQKAVLTAQVKSVEASVNIARLQLPHLEYASPVKKKIIELQIERSEVEKSKLTNRLTALEAIQKSEIVRLKMKIKQIENKLSRAKMKLDRLTLRSTADGIISYCISWMTGDKVKEGDAVWGSMPILEIPEVSILQVNVKIGETYVKRVKKDQRVNIQIDALPDLPLEGTVSKVASVGKPIKRKSKIKNFEVIVALDSTLAQLQPGFSATCEIIVESFKDTLVVPYSCIFQDDSLQVVYVKEGEKFKKQVVKTGNKAEYLVLITEGLSGGEEIAFSEPPNSLVKGIEAE